TARIKFRLQEARVYLISNSSSGSSRAVYKVLKRHGLNRLSCKLKIRKYRRFEKKHPNDWYRWTSRDRSTFVTQARKKLHRKLH
ncbi:MAG TPA: hypothetical protein VNI77_10680, partial [Nitrososphaera sp.]|nr:hypothetical protein [Nitrososphaera sp.]